MDVGVDVGVTDVFYERHIAPCTQQHQLLLILRDFEIQLGVFKAGAVDTIRIHPIHEVLDTERHLAAVIIQEVHGLIRQYEGEDPSEGDGWQVLMVAGQQPALPIVVQWNFRKTLPGAQVVVVDDQTAGSLVPLDPEVTCEHISGVPLGMALREENAFDSVPRLNLLPPRILRLKQVKRQGLITSVVAVMVLLVMMVSAPIVSVHADKIKDELRQRGPGQDGQTMSSLIDQCDELETRSKNLQAMQHQLQELQCDRDQLNWSQCLDDVRQALPDHLWFTHLEGSQDKKILMIEGRSITWNALSRYIESLGHSSSIRHVKIVRWDFVPNGDVVFSISCRLNVQDETSSD